MKRMIIFCVLSCFLMGNLFGQEKNRRFSDLSGPEKCWVVWHPFKAKRALEITVRTLQVTDSVKKEGAIGSDGNGGQLDAFKHAFWMAALSKEIGQKAALKLGRAHEKGNYRSFKKDKSSHDEASSEMDQFNNEAGVRIYEENPGASASELSGHVISSLLDGRLKILKKDDGIFLTCSGEKIATESLQGQWQNEKCLVPSNDY